MSPFLLGITLLLVFQCAGEIVAHVTRLPIPGPVLGMLALLVVLRVRDRVDRDVHVAAEGLAKHLSLLFVPAGVGVMLHAGQLAGQWLAVAAALVLSTVAAIAAAAVTFAHVLKRTRALTGPGARE